jgi:hypothetical protein
MDTMTREKQSKPKQRKNFLLSDSTMGLLARMDNASRYIDQLVQVRQRRILRSLEILSHGGWSMDEIAAVCEVSNGKWESVACPGDYSEFVVRISTSDVDGLDLERRIYESFSIAHAIHEVVSEYWCGNTEIRNLCF